MLDEFKKALLKRFQGTDEGPVEQDLGCQLIRDLPHRVSKQVQTVYFERLLEIFNMWGVEAQELCRAEEFSVRKTGRDFGGISLHRHPVNGNVYSER